MILDCNNIIHHRWLTIDEVLPYPQYQSGAREEQKPVYKDYKDPSSNPVLILEFDILNKDGFGLKKGYYEIATDSEYKTLMFVESGNIKAKIPVIKEEMIDNYQKDWEWQEEEKRGFLKSSNKPKTTSEEIPVYSKDVYKEKLTEKEAKKRKNKYKKGQDPRTYFHSKCYMEYDNENDLYKVIWEKYHIRLIGIIKLY